MVAEVGWGRSLGGGEGGGGERGEVSRGSDADLGWGEKKVGNASCIGNRDY